MIFITFLTRNKKPVINDEEIKPVVMFHDIKEKLIRKPLYKKFLNLNNELGYKKGCIPNFIPLLKYFFDLVKSITISKYQNCIYHQFAQMKHNCFSFIL